MNSGKSPTPLILALDDEPSIQEILTDFFSLLDYRFIAFSSASNALDFVAEHTPDLIITDLQLTESDGLKFASQCKAINKSTPILLLTGVSIDPRVARKLAGQAVDAIQSKTGSLNELREKVIQLLGGG